MLALMMLPAAAAQSPVEGQAALSVIVSSADISGLPPNETVSLAGTVTLLRDGASPAVEGDATVTVTLVRVPDWVDATIEPSSFEFTWDPERAPEGGTSYEWTGDFVVHLTNARGPPTTTRENYFGGEYSVEARLAQGLLTPERSSVATGDIRPPITEEGDAREESLAPASTEQAPVPTPWLAAPLALLGAAFVARRLRR